ALPICGGSSLASLPRNRSHAFAVFPAVFWLLQPRHFDRRHLSLLVYFQEGRLQRIPRAADVCSAYQHHHVVLPGLCPLECSSCYRGLSAPASALSTAGM